MLWVISADVFEAGTRPSRPVHRRCCSDAISLGSLWRCPPATCRSVTCRDLDSLSASDRGCPRVLILSGTQRARTLRSVGVGTSSRTVRYGRCAGPIFHSSLHGTRLVQRLGNSVGNSHGVLALILDRLLFRPGVCQVAVKCASVLCCRRWLPLTVGRCCCCHRWCQAGPGPSQLDLGGHRQRS